MPALQLPYVREPAEQKGRRLFRKQLLPIGEVHHPQHDRLEFSRDRLEKIVEAFRGGAHDMVPFVLAANDTSHPDDPERIRGEVKGLELASDGLYGLIETDERGAELVARYPNFPVSVRVRDPLDGKHPEALEHVSAAADAVIRGMRPWEAIEAAGSEPATDLSAGSFSPSGGSASTPGISTEADTKGTDALTEDEQGVFRTLLAKVTGGGKADNPERKSDDPSKGEPGKTDEPELSDEEVNEIVAGLVKEAEEAEPEKEPVAAANDNRKAIEMAVAEKTKPFELKAGKSELESKLAGYVKEGVPPAMVEAARDLLSHDETLIELANDREPAAATKTFEALDKAKGTIEFSERGSLAGEESDEAKQLAKKMGEQYGKDGR